MVASQQVDALRELELIGEEKSNDLDAKCPPVHIIAKEEILLGGWASVFGEKVQQIIKLSK